MKNIAFIILFISSLSYSQGNFKYEENGLSPKFLVIKVDSLKQNQVFEKAMKWIKLNYKNPDEVIETSVENEIIRFTGIEQRVLSIGKSKKIDYDLKHTISISFKDGKYKFEPLNIMVKASDFNYGWIPFDLNNGKMYFKKGKMIKKFDQYVIKIPEFLNNLSLEIKKTSEKTEDDW
ncbi:DUF4468 domain-containing protein [Tenacibaculum finnmarkense]|uniref:DUF4468 domain-containing protein n=1 Tax=Tenacibaculum finnmarkense TaxID=2781243 RepID=UPI001EFAC4FB|nr:DUF4468 domain-containing protein [Tenacibaculum finnmarkense]MCG8796638.1 DUF4468 domain-containing protein [Tenacibaculum finnmarkense]MCG8798972.1 DUF4468 domain-containing protein [Tenacibaculum finnmarkense]